MEIYKAIAAVQGEMAETGIKKDKTNKVQGYNFRGIDDVYNALAPLLSKHALCILPRAVDRVCVERQTKNGGVLFYTTVKCEFDFVSAIDDSKHTIITYGEAMDSADKSTNKAMSAAYKYAAFQAFCIPVDVVDADAETHKEILPKPEEKTPPAQSSSEEISSYISEAQVKRLFAISKKAGWPTDNLKSYLINEFGINHSNEIPRSKYEEICTYVENHTPYE